jgi:hypothetical protein
VSHQYYTRLVVRVLINLERHHNPLDRALSFEVDRARSGAAPDLVADVDLLRVAVLVLDRVIVRPPSPYLPEFAASGSV